MTLPRFPKSGSGSPKQRAPHRFQNVESSDSARNIIGVIHLLLGAWVVAGGVVVAVAADGGHATACVAISSD